MNVSIFEVKFQNGDDVLIEAFNAEQAGILAAADRIRAGLVKLGNEHRVASIRFVDGLVSIDAIRPASLAQV